MIVETGVDYYFFIVPAPYIDEAKPESAHLSTDVIGATRLETHSEKFVFSFLQLNKHCAVEKNSRLILILVLKCRSGVMQFLHGRKTRTPRCK